MKGNKDKKSLVRSATHKKNERQREKTQILARKRYFLLITVIRYSLPILVSNGHVLESKGNGFISYDLVLYISCLSNSLQSDQDCYLPVLRGSCFSQ